MITTLSLSTSSLTGRTKSTESRFHYKHFLKLRGPGFLTDLHTTQIQFRLFQNFDGRMDPAEPFYDRKMKFDVGNCFQHAGLQDRYCSTRIIRPTHLRYID